MSRRRLWMGIALLAVVAAAVALLRGPAADVLGLAGSGGELQLRETMRPAGTGARVLVFALDGTGDDVLRDAIAAGVMPNVSRLFGASGAERGRFAHAYAADSMLSIVPSTTLAAWASIFTGEPPAKTGVPGNEWFARETRRFYAPAPVSIEAVEDALAAYTDDLVGNALQVPTLFERADVRSYVMLSHIHRGADLLIMPDAGDLAAIVLTAAAGLIDDDDAEAAPYRNLDVGAADELLEAIGRHGLADLQVVYFPGIDLYTHVASPPLDEQRRYLADVTDGIIGRILNAYAAAGALDDTYVIFISDHGHTPVLDDDRHALEAEGDNEPPAVLEQVGFRMRPLKLQLDADEEDFSAAVAYQGAFAYVYLADRSRCPAPGDRCDWGRAPRLEEDVLPVVRAFDAANRTGAGVAALRGTLDLIFARPPRPTGTDALPFEVWDGERLVPVGEYLAHNPRPDLLDLEARLHGLGAGPFGHRSGDVLLLAKSGMERPIAERFYFSGRYRSWHGSPAAQDSRVPLIVARRGADGDQIRQLVRGRLSSPPSQLDLAGLVLHLLEQPATAR